MQALGEDDGDVDAPEESVGEISREPSTTAQIPAIDQEFKVVQIGEDKEAMAALRLKQKQ